MSAEATIQKEQASSAGAEPCPRSPSADDSLSRLAAGAENAAAATESGAVESGAVESGETPDDASFAEMLARHEREEAPQSRLAPGQRVSARIVAVTADTIFVSTGSKVDGIVDREELEEDGQLSRREGDMLDLYVVTVSPQEVKLSRILRGAGSLTALEEAKEAGLPVEGKVIGQIKGGYAVDIMKRRAFCPSSQIDLRPLGDPETPVGKIYPFLITRLEKNGRNIVVSRRSLLEREQRENRDALLEEIKEGDVREAVVSRLTPFGAFVELAPGVEGLIHLSELSWSRVARADEAVSAGDAVRVKILGIAKEDKGARISLSIKQTAGDPWKEVEGRFAAGDILSGRVTRNAPFGAFVEIAPGIEGLVHLSEFSYEKRVIKADEVVAPGDTVSVRIKELDTAKKRISLSMRDVEGDPWGTIGRTLAVDAELTGTVEKHTPFGLFVNLSPGVTGLLPNSVIHASPCRKTLEKLKTGDAVAVRVKEIDEGKRRVSLAPAGEENPAAEEKDWKRHAPKTAPAPVVGPLGLALRAAMKKKK
ncbi:MAG: 30S ribosomal protein S1 [Desulfovibrio sp.]|jgi:small subunit ribosomal protein S1|nr:30S ribosomal protein S1 [Desulfovibrio sp.]